MSMPSDVFDQLFERGRQAVLSGQVLTDKPPMPGDGRWGLSIVLRPGEALATQLQEVTEQALLLTGEHHWATGSAGAAHLTVRSLEPHRGRVRPEDAQVQRYAAALRCAAEQVGPIDVEVTGLTLSPRSVMARVIATDSLLDILSSALEEALGPDGWYETQAGVERDAWYMNLVHFAGPVRRPEELVEWVDDCRSRHLGVASLREAHLVEWSFDGQRMKPNSLITAPLS
jgi:hypothetical protein